MTGRILIADAQATRRITLKVRLTSACYDAFAVGDLAQLLRMAHDRRPDLIVIGGDLPDADVAGACARLRADAVGADIAILALCRADLRLAAMRAGASATLDPAADELVLLARLRSLLRGTEESTFDFAETQTAFVPAPATLANPLPRVTLVAHASARALVWKHALSRHLPYQFAIRDAEQALTEAADGAAADLYLIAADLDMPGEGLRLLSELQARRASRDSAFVIAVPETRADLMAIALDLGAGDTLSPEFADPALIQFAAIALREQMARKTLADHRRAEARQSLIWSVTDPLTGLYNRRYALPRLTDTLRAAQRLTGGCAILAVDVDHFKHVNDRFGHAAGDGVLIEIAARMRAAVEQRGLTARMGGEEFLVILPDASAHDAAECAAHIRDAIGAHPIALPSLIGGGAVAVTVSIGIAVYRPSDPIEPDTAHLADLMQHRADQALQRAKAAGRDCIFRCRAEIAA